MAKTFNLRSIKTVQSFDLPIKDVDGKETGVVFTLTGPTHPARKSIAVANQAKIFTSMASGQRSYVSDVNEAEAKKPKDLAASTLGWHGYTDEKGEAVPFASATAEALYGDLEMQWLVDQVEAALGNKALFTRSASAS